MSAKVAPEPEDSNPKKGDDINALESSTSTKKVRASQAASFGFSDPEKIKERVKEQVKKPEPYNVFDFYHKEGHMQAIAKHIYFENTTLGVISANAVYIALDTDWNQADALLDYDWYFQIMEHLFCLYFTFEWIVRFCAFKHKKNCVRDAWFVFDSILVFLMVMETWVLVVIMAASGSSGGSPLGNTAMLRLLRLLRLSRLMRMLRSLPELMILIKGMIKAMTSVFYVMCLLLILTYVFAIAFTQLSVDTPTIGETYFANVGFSMYSLLIYATFLDDLSNLMDDCRADKWPLVFVALIFICLASMTLMNMLIGVLCEVVDGVAQEEKKEMMELSVCSSMYDVAKRLDTNFNGKISYEEFQKILDDKHALGIMEQVGVNPCGIVDFSEMFFFDEDGVKELEFEEFMDMMMSLRQENNAKTKDVLDLWRRMKETTAKDIDDIEKKVRGLEDASSEWNKSCIKQVIEDTFSSIDVGAKELKNLTEDLKNRR